MKFLIDTNVLIDVALDRFPHSGSAAEFLDTVEQRPGVAFVAWHSISNFYYLVAPSGGSDWTRSFVHDLTRFVEIAPTTTANLTYACQLVMRDFEDAMQVAAAVACQAEVIVTRNLKDFKSSPVRAMEPQAALERLANH